MVTFARAVAMDPELAEVFARVFPEVYVRTKDTADYYKMEYDTETGRIWMNGKMPKTVKYPVYIVGDRVLEYVYVPWFLPQSDVDMLMMRAGRDGQC